MRLGHSANIDYQLYENIPLIPRLADTEECGAFWEWQTLSLACLSSLSSVFTIQYTITWFVIKNLVFKLDYLKNFNDLQSFCAALQRLNICSIYREEYACRCSQWPKFKFEEKIFKKSTIYGHRCLLYCYACGQHTAQWDGLLKWQ